MMLDTWAAQWGINPQAIEDLKNRFGVLELVKSDAAPGSEADAQNLIRLEMSRAGGRIWRNNVGAGTIQESGSFMRWGLANESKAVNKRIKSSDLIGLRPVLIEPGHVGGTIGQFVAREVKRPGWRYTGGTERERAQLKFLELVLSMGGDAAFAVGPGTL